MNCGLLGRKLGHSYSPQIHADLGNYSYTLHELEPEALGPFLQTQDFTGLNVTIPYKKDVIPYCTELSPIAKQLGAVNTIVKKADGSLIGHNTDYTGFYSCLAKTRLSVKGKKVLVLGSGGASVTAVTVLRELGADVIVISREGSDNYSNLNKHADAVLIVNATPVGMYPNCGVSPVDLDTFPNLEGVIDMIYNPARTKLLIDAEQRGLVAENGLWMLVAQAKESAEWFTGGFIDESSVAYIHSKLHRQMENVILIGMPGCGKSTVGNFLAKELGKTFIDADSYLEEMTDKKITDIFAKEGEEAFRRYEIKALAELGKRSGCVIATGGGCVTRPENYVSLHQNGSIFWLKRDLNSLPKDGRPLSISGNLEKMYAVRKPLYEAFCDHQIINNSTPEAAVCAILALL